MKLEIKKEYLGTVVGFNGSAKPLGERNDIYLLAEIAVKTKSKALLRFFKTIPSQKDINDLKVSEFIKNNPLPKRTQKVKKSPVKAKSTEKGVVKRPKNGK